MRISIFRSWEKYEGGESVDGDLSSETMFAQLSWDRDLIILIAEENKFYYLEMAR